jgi:hypothetical protein
LELKEEGARRGCHVPPLSVALGVTHPWPAAKSCLEILVPQCQACDAELLLADATGQALPDPVPDTLQCVRTIVMPRASIFDLRAGATAAATGSIVAWTEDHCRPAPDWCARILRAHEERPHSAVIGGAVVNGSKENLMDWANFLCTFGPLVPPFNGRRINRAPGVANVSFKRCVIPPGRLAAGFIELVVQGRLMAEGKVHFDDRIVVEHIQTWGLWAAAAVHFHNGRSTTGLIASRMDGARRWDRILDCLSLPADILIAGMESLGKPDIPLLRCLPLMAALAISHAVGELTGLLFRSAGHSPRRLE